MESYLQDEINFQTPEYIKSRLNDLEGKYIHSTPFHPVSLGSTNGKTTPLCFSFTDEGYSSVGSSSTPTGIQNNLLTSEVINQYKDYTPIGCIHNSINQREKLEIVALELLNQARLIPNYPCSGRLMNRNILGINEENNKPQPSYLSEFNEKYPSLLQSNIGNYHYPSIVNQHNECGNISRQEINYPKLLSSMNTNICQHLNNKQLMHEQLNYSKEVEKISKTNRNDNNNHYVNDNVNCMQLNESRSQICNQILGQVRREMIRLIDNSMHQLETYLQNHHYKEWSNSPTILDYCNSLKSVQTDNIQDCNVTPLNLKFTRNTNQLSVENVNNDKIIVNQLNEMKLIPTQTTGSSELKSNNLKCTTTTTTTTSTGSSSNSTKIKSLRLNNKTRRLRIHQFNSQLFTDRNQLKKLNRLSPSCNKRQLNDDNDKNNKLQESPNKIPHLDESLDLRVHQNNHEENNQLEPTTPSNNHSQTRLKRTLMNNQSRTTTLSAIHLKKAKMMFMYSRYPTSNLLKSYFPEVCFNRGSTAQLVKWFSNFREFFYIQIEKYVRQQKAAGLKKADDIRLSREHELIRSMETHFNKGDDIETPKEFLEAIQIAVWEFADAVLNERDANSSWKKTIYKKISILDIQFPEFFRC
ncbi:Prospero homeobox protein 1 [Schistosoma japonicum]|nr:Prospero homeobox protein 1 [Schistosoma japonicum]